MHLFHKRLALAALAAATVAMSGCYTFRYTTNRPFAGERPVEQWRNRFINGLIDDGPVDLTALCPNGTFALVEHQMNFANFLLTGASQLVVLWLVGAVPVLGQLALVWFQLWPSSTVRVQCAAHPGTEPPPALPPERRRELDGR